MNCVKVVVAPALPSAPMSSRDPGAVAAPGAAEADESAFCAIAFGGPMRISALPRSVSAPRFLPSGNSSSAFLARVSKRSRNSFSGVFRSGSRRAQKRATNFSASWSDAIFFHSFFSSSVARYAYSGDLSQSLYLSRAASVGSAAAKARRSRERAEPTVRFMGDFLPVAGAGRGPSPRSRQPREYTSMHTGQGPPETLSTFDPSRRMVILKSVRGPARAAHHWRQTVHPACVRLGDGDETGRHGKCYTLRLSRVWRGVLTGGACAGAARLLYRIHFLS